MRHMKHFAALTVALTVFVAATVARADCPRIPETPVWGKVANGDVVGYVDSAYKGNWGAYLRTWEKRRAALRDVMARDSILAFHNTGLQLKGKDLAAYADAVDKRIAVMGCLAAAAANGKSTGASFAGTASKDGS